MFAVGGKDYTSEKSTLSVFNFQKIADKSKSAPRLNDSNAMSQSFKSPFSSSGKITSALAQQPSSLDKGIQLLREFEIEGKICNMNFSPCEQFLAYGCSDGKVYVRSTTADMELLHLFPLKKASKRLRFDHDSRLLGCVGLDHCLRVWEISEETAPYPYEFSAEWFMEHYVAKKTTPLIPPELWSPTNNNDQRR